MVFEEYMNKKNFVTWVNVKLFLFKVLKVIYAPSHPDYG